MRVIGMLFGIPEQDQEAIRDRADATLRTEAGKPMHVSQTPTFGSDMFAEYIDWRVEHPADDLMTELLQAEFEDETGTIRRLTRDEALLYTTVVAGAGNETTTRLIGWAGKVLAEHPDQRRELVEDRSLIPSAIEELLRYEPPAPHIARYVPEEVELYDRSVPAGSAMLFLVGAANRDDRHFRDPDRFDIHRESREAPHVRLRDPLLHRRGACSSRRSSCARRGPDALPDVGRRLGWRQAGAHLDRSRLAVSPRRDLVTS